MSSVPLFHQKTPLEEEQLLINIEEEKSIGSVSSDSEEAKEADEVKLVESDSEEAEVGLEGPVRFSKQTDRSPIEARIQMPSLSRGIFGSVKKQSLRLF